MVHVSQVKSSRTRADSVSGSLTVRQLEVFAMASRCSTFSEAAKRLGISQPSLSNTIAKIETQLGLRLFDRTTRSMVLTAQGERLSVVADELVRNFQASLQNIHAAAGASRGRLSMAVIPSVAAALGPRVLNAFFATYPQFDVALHDVAGDKALAWVLDRVVDFAIVATPPAASELHIEPLFTDSFQVFCRKDHSLASRRSVSWKDLEATAVILAGAGAIRRDVEGAWARDNASIGPRFEFEQTMTGLAMVAGGLGVAVLPALCRPEGLHRDVVAIPLGRNRIEREIAVVRRSDRALSEPVRHMLDCFRHVIDTR